MELRLQHGQEVDNRRYTEALVSRDGHQLVEIAGQHGIKPMGAYRKIWYPWEIACSTKDIRGQHTMYRYITSSGGNRFTNPQGFAGCKAITLFIIAGHYYTAATIQVELRIGTTFSSGTGLSSDHATVVSPVSGTSKPGEIAINNTANGAANFKVLSSANPIVSGADYNDLNRCGLATVWSLYFNGSTSNIPLTVWGFGE